MLRALSTGPCGLVLLFVITFLQPAFGREPGDLIRVSEIRGLSAEELFDLQDENQESPDEKRAINGIRYFKILYATTGIDAGPATASGLVMLPVGENLPAFPLLSFQHGTESKRKFAPSYSPLYDETLVATLLYAAHGYLVAVPDGLGLGDSNVPFQPYVHAITEASSAIDMLKATQKLSIETGFALSGQLFLAGYSQGGHWTMALHRQLEEKPLPGLKIAASAPMAGPFDLSNTTLHFAFANPGPFSSVFMALGLFSMQSIYGNIAKCWGEILTEPSASRMPVLFDGNHSLGAIYRKLAKTPETFYQPAFVEGLLKNPDHPLRQDLEKNDVYNWTPKSPMILVHSRGDESVPYQNSELTFTAMLGRGAPVEFVTLPGKKGHTASFLPANRVAAEWFEKYRN